MKIHFINFQNGRGVYIVHTKLDHLQADTRTKRKWRGSVGGLVGAPVAQVWSLVSKSSRLSEWMPMVENCTALKGEEGKPGHVRLVSGFMFPQDDGDRSWIKERLVLVDPEGFSYVYRMEASNVGLDGSVNSLRLVDYGEGSTLVDWSFEIDPVDGASEDGIVDYLGFVYKCCINRIEGAISSSSSSFEKEAESQCVAAALRPT